MGFCLLGFFAISASRADNRVVIVARAEPDYTEQKFSGAQPRRETYVVMQGRYFGSATVDRSLERMNFREILGYLSPKLALQQFVPAATIPSADLLLVVHWGVTNPRASALDLAGRTSLLEGSPSDPVTHAEYNDAELIMAIPGGEDRAQQLERVSEAAADEAAGRDLAQLLGYAETLKKYQQRAAHSTAEETLRFDFKTERYFIVVKAFDLRPPSPIRSPKPVWSLHINISSPGNNFRTALARMSDVAPHFAGRTSRDVETVRSKVRETQVEIGDLIILDHPQ